MLLGTFTATSDDAEFKRSPADFCSSRVQQQGLAFSTTAFDGAVLAGDDAALSLVLGDDAELEEPEALLGEPFPGTSETYDAISGPFNRVCYDELFEWIPKYKEAGGFSTFRFDDFLDSRVRVVRSSVRQLLLRATMPLTLGVSWDDAVKLVESDALASVGVSKIGDLVGLYESFAQQSGGSGGAFGALSRLTGAGGEAKLQTSLATLAGGGDGAALLRSVFSSVEQSTALVCNLLGQTVAHEDWDRQLAAEQEVALDGWGPQEPIGSAQLAAMPKLRAFTQETLRLLPPARPSRLRLRKAAVCGGLQLAAGTLLQPEPFIAHMRADTYPDPGRFDPTRFVQPEQAPAHLGFAGPVQGSPGAELATALAQATFVQMRRMFELRPGKEPPFVPAGYPISSIPEGCQVLAEARMYYELKRENKKLRF